MENLKNVWPGQCTGAVSLTFDDGDSSQLRHAVPVLQKFGLRGTFYLRPGDGFEKALEPWKAVFEKGHEIGNHSLGHRCSRNLSGVVGGAGLETMTIEDIEADLSEAERRLQSMFPVDGGRSFAYPCYQTHVGEGLTRQSYVPVVARLFVAGRAGGEYGLFNHPFNTDLHCLVACACERMSGAELVGLAERAARRGHWVVFVFHRLEGGRLGINAFDFAELVEHLAAFKDRFWTAPVAEVARHLGKIKGERAT